MGLEQKITLDGHKNTAVQLTSNGIKGWHVALAVDKLSPRPKEVRLDAVYYCIEDGVTVTLAWGSENSDERFPFLPLRGCGRIDFSEVSGLHNTASQKTGHIDIKSSSETGLFTIVLDLSKHVGN